MLLLKSRFQESEQLVSVVAKNPKILGEPTARRQFGTLTNIDPESLRD
jgi:hypothetical protein